MNKLIIIFLFACIVYSCNTTKHTSTITNVAPVKCDMCRTQYDTPH